MWPSSIGKPNLARHAQVLRHSGGGCQSLAVATPHGQVTSRRRTCHPSCSGRSCSTNGIATPSTARTAERCILHLRNRLPSVLPIRIPLPADLSKPAGGQIHDQTDIQVFKTFNLLLTAHWMGLTKPPTTINEESCRWYAEVIPK